MEFREILLLPQMVSLILMLMILKQAAFMRHGMTQKEIEVETIIQLAAGSDTTATTIRATMLYIMTTPRVYFKLKAEIRTAVGSGNVSLPITNDQAKGLPYLQAVIMEGLRIRPPLTFGFYKRLPPGTATIVDGLVIPGGTAVGINAVAMMRTQSIFGQDVQTFRPERFLECSSDMRGEMVRTVELAFGYGRWMCVGKTLAFTELNKIFFEVRQRLVRQRLLPYIDLW